MRMLRLPVCTVAHFSCCILFLVMSASLPASVPSSVFDRTASVASWLPLGAVVLAVGAGVALVTSSVVKHLRRFPPQKKGVVYLYQFPVAPDWDGAPSASPFCLKVEAFMRAANIPYEVVWTIQTHPETGKLPYIRLDEVVVPDSTLAVQHLTDYFHVDLDAHLSPQQRAVGHAMMKMLETSFSVSGIQYERWITHSAVMNRYILGLPEAVWRAMRPLLTGNMQRHMRGVGIDSFSPVQVEALAQADIDAVAVQLGQQRFLLGNYERPALCDVVVLSFIGLILWDPFPSVHKQYIRKVSCHAGVRAGRQAAGT